MELAEYIKIYVFPTGRRYFAHAQVRERAEAANLTRLVAHLDRAMAHDRETLQVELRRRASPQARFSPEAGRLDALLDRAISGLDALLESYIRVYGDTGDLGAAATAVRDAIFPDGVRAITHLPYIQEDLAVAAVLERLRQPDMTASLAKLPGADDMVEEVRARHSEYHEVLGKEREGPSADEVRAMQLEGHNKLCGTVTLILANYVETEDRELTRGLLAPIERQAQDIREARRRRRMPLDVDPDTGEEVNEPEMHVPDDE